MALHGARQQGGWCEEFASCDEYVQTEMGAVTCILLIIYSNVFGCRSVKFQLKAQPGTMLALPTTFILISLLGVERVERGHAVDILSG